MNIKFDLLRSNPYHANFIIQAGCPENLDNFVEGAEAGVNKLTGAQSAGDN